MKQLRACATSLCLAVICALLALSATSGVAAPRRMMPTFEPSKVDCPRQGPYCRLRQEVNVSELERRLGDSTFASWVEGQNIHIAVRAAERPMFCCSIQQNMARVGDTDLWSLSLHVPRLDEAVILLAYMDQQYRLHPHGEFRGPQAPLPPVIAAPLAGRIEEMQFESEALQGEVPVSIYRPPAALGPPRAAIYLADGDVQTYAPVLEPLMVQGRIPPTMMVGFAAWLMPGADHATRSTLRNGQYRRGSDPAAMRRHDRFVLEELIPKLESGDGSASLARLTAGASNGGAWAMTTAMAYPAIFKGAVSTSPAVRGADLTGLPGAADQSYFFTAGLFEGMDNAKLAFDRVRQSPARACILEGVDGHSMSLQRDFFPLAVEAALTDGPCPSWPHSSPRSTN